MERKGHKRVEIKSVDDFNDICCDMVSEWLEDFQEREGLVRPVDEDDCVDTDMISFMYTHRAMNMYGRYRDRLAAVGMKYFEEDDISISSHLVIEE